MQLKPLRITSGRHPFQVAIVATVFLLSTLLLVSGVQPRALQGLPSLVTVTWLGMLVVGGAGALTGAYWPGALSTALIIEGGAVSMVSAMTTLYVLLLVAGYGLDAATSGGLIMGISAAGWWRAYQVGRDLRRLWRAEQCARLTQVTVLSEDGRA